MYIEQISVENLRNHNHTELTLSPGLNIFYGLNGAGKTTVLEAVSIAGFSKSFLLTQDAALIKKGENYYQISANARTDYNTPYRVCVNYTLSKRKQINSTLGDNLLPKQIIGNLPQIALSPDFKAITYGAPEDRRQFVDRILSQTGKIYIEELYKLKRIIKQRNIFLNNAKLEKKYDGSLLNTWTEALVNTSVEIIYRRNAFINEFQHFFVDNYSKISESKESVELKYIPNGINGSARSFSQAELYGILIELFKKSINIELYRGTTIYGPQKDEIQVLINSGIARDYASQGQHKTLLISLKFAEFDYIMNQIQETPIILLDDIFSELDSERTAKVFDLIYELKAQTFITLTDVNQISKFTKSDNCSVFCVENGRINQINY